MTSLIASLVEWTSPSAPAIAADDRPNIVFIMTDDQTVDDMRFMPKTRQLLGDHGTTYSNSWTSLSWCCPSRATLKTGQHAHNHGVYSNSLPAGGFGRFQDETALPVWLQRAGYRTVHIGKAMNDTGLALPAGWDRWQATVAGDHKMYNWRTVDENGAITTYGSEASDHQGDVYTQMVVDEIHDAGDEPFFIHFTPSAPHRGDGGTATPPQRHLNTFDESLPRPPSFNQPANFSNTDLLQLTKEYRRRAESLYGVDDSVEQVVRALEESGQLDDTVIVFTSDNGFLLGEHGLYGKSNYFREAMAVPLVIRGPGFGSGVVESAPVQNIDLAVTAADLADAVPLVVVDGISLAGPLSPDRGLFFESKRDDPAQPLWDGVRGERFVLVESHENPNGDRLWDMQLDPWQLQNVVDDPAYDQVEAVLRSHLAAVRTCSGAACTFDIDNAALAALVSAEPLDSGAPTGLESATGPGTNISFIAGSSPPPTADQQMVDRWTSRGFDVAVHDDGSIDVDRLRTSDLVWISPSVQPGLLTDTLADLDVPVVVDEPLLLDDMAMATTTGFLKEQRSVLIDDAPIVVNTRLRSLSWGRPAESASVVARLSDGTGRPTIFDYADGATLVDGSPSPSCRGAFLSGFDRPDLNSAGLDLFDDITDLMLGCTSEPNTPPMLTAVDDRTEAEGTPVQFEVQATDADGDPLQFDAIGLPEGMSVGRLDGAISGTISHAAAAASPSTVTVTVSDGRDSATTEFTWTVLPGPNQPPELAPIADRVDAVGAPIELAVSATDLDRDALTWTAESLPPGLSIDPDSGLVSGSPTPDSLEASPFVVSIVASDGEASAAAAFAWAITEEVVAPRVLFVAGRSPVVAADRPMVERLESRGIDVAVLDDDQVARFDGFDEFDAIWVSSTVSPSKVGNRLAQLPVPVGLSEAFLFDDTLLATRVGQKSSQRFVRNPDGGLVQTTNVARTYSWGVVGSSADVLATIPSSRTFSAVFTYATGDRLTDGSEAPACRAGYLAGFDSPAVLTDEGWAYLDTVVDVLLDCQTTDGPLLTLAPIPDRLDNVGATISFPVVTVDGDGEPLIYSATGLPEGVGIDGETGTIAGIIATAAITSTVAVTVLGPSGAATTSFFWGVNRLPVMAPIADRADLEDVEVDGHVVVDDADGDTIRFAATGLPPGVQIDTMTGAWLGAPASDASFDSPYTVTVTTDDGRTGIAVDSFTWVVEPGPNNDPQLASLPDRSDAEGDAVQIAVQVVEPDRDEVFFQASGLPDGVTIDEASGVLSGAAGPSAALSSPYLTTITVTDGLGGIDAVDFEWTILPGPNQIPSLTPIDDQTSIEGDLVAFTVDAEDVDGDELSWSANGLPSGIDIDSTTGRVSGQLGHATALRSPYDVVIEVVDIHGARSTTQFIWSISPGPNQTPLFQHVDDRIDTIDVDVVGGVHATDADDDALVYAAVGLPPGIRLSATTGAFEGALPFDSFENSPYTVVVTATDAAGASDTAQFEWRVNRTPTLTVPPPQLWVEGDTIDVTVAASDADGDALSYSMSAAPEGIDIDSQTGRISGTLARNAADAAPYLVQITVTDDLGGTATASWNIDVAAGPNQAPIVSPLPDRLHTVGDRVLFVVVAEDPDLDTVDFAAEGLPLGMSIDRTTGEVDGILLAGATTGDVTVTVSDGNGGSAVATFRFEVNDAPVPPVLSDQIHSPGESVAVSAATVDSDGDALHYSVDGLPAGLLVDGDGLISGVIAASASDQSPYLVTVLVTDGRGGTAVSTFSWTVDSPPSVPPLADLRTREAQPIDVDVEATDPEGGSVTFTATGLPSGVDISSGSGRLIGAPAFGTASPAPFDVTVYATDSAGRRTAVSFEWLVEELQIDDYIRDVGQQSPVIGESSFGKPCVGDIDGNGAKDTVWSVHKKDIWDVFLGDDAGGFTPHTADWTVHDNHGCVLADFDNDGDVDLFAPQGACQGTCLKRDRIYLQMPSGRFVVRDYLLGEQTKDRSRHAVAFDHDNDGLLDLFISASGSTTGSQHRIMENRGFDSNGAWLGFRELSVGVERASGNSECAGTADFDNDGLTDVFVCQGDGFFIYQNQGSDGFTDYPSNIGIVADPAHEVTALEPVDFDGDGWLDVVVVRDKSVEIRFNDGGNLDVVSWTTPVTKGYEAVTPDIDGDGDLDLLIVQAQSGQDPSSVGAHQLWINTDGGGSEWTRVDIPQPDRGAGDKAQVFEDFRGSGRDAVLIGNGGQWDTKGPRQWLAIAEIPLTGKNAMPTVTAPDDRADDEYTDVSFQVGAQDADGDDLSFAATGLPPGVRLDATTGIVSGRLTGVTESITHEVRLTVSDGQAEATTRFGWTVNETGADPPLSDGPLNVIVVMTDDQTVEQMRWLPNVGAFMSAGTQFQNSLTNYPLCGPSRVTFLTGRYATNHQLECNDGIASKFHQVENESLAPWLHESGVHTIHVGKYLNGYGGSLSTRYTPAGWSDWRALAGTSAYKYETFDMVIDGDLRQFGRNGESAYSTDILSDELDDALRTAPPDDPFFAVFTPLAPHFQVGTNYAIPAERHENSIDAVRRPPNYGSCLLRATCPTTGSDLNRNHLSAAERNSVDHGYQTSSESLLAVDEAFARIVTTLTEIERLDDTVIIFTSDNGFSYGEHGLERGKKVPTRESLFVPLLIAGPNIERGIVDSPVVNADLAPTILDLFGIEVDAEFDGQSLLTPVDEDRAILIQAKPQPGTTGYYGVFADGWLFIDWVGVVRNDLYAPSDPWQLDSVDQAAWADEIEARLAQLTSRLRVCRGDSCAVTWRAPD